MRTGSSITGALSDDWRKRCRSGGFSDLAAGIEAYDRQGKRITAIEISFSSPSHRRRVPDEHGYLDPHMETGFYCDDADYPFSTLDRASLLHCYAPNRGKWLGNAKWQGAAEDVDDVITVTGIGDLYGAVFRLTKSGSGADEQQGRVLGACYLAVLVHVAVRDCAALHALARPMAVIVGSNQDYPFFQCAGCGGTVEDLHRPVGWAQPIVRYPLMRCFCGNDLLVAASGS